MSVPSFYDSTFTLAGGALFTVLLVTACAYDIRWRRLPNSVVAATAVCGLAYSAFVYGAHGVARSALGLLLGLAIWLPFYAIGWIGAGDVKLFAAVGAWLWPARTFEAAIVAALSGAVLSLLWMVYARGAYRTGVDLSVAFAARRGVPLSPEDARRVLPYGVALALGALAATWLPDPVRSAIYATH